MPEPSQASGQKRDATLSEACGRQHVWRTNLLSFVLTASECGGGTIKLLSRKQYTHKLPRVASCRLQLSQVCT